MASPRRYQQFFQSHRADENFESFEHDRAILGRIWAANADAAVAAAADGCDALCAWRAEEARVRPIPQPEAASGEELTDAGRDVLRTLGLN